MIWYCVCWCPSGQSGGSGNGASKVSNLMFLLTESSTISNWLCLLNNVFQKKACVVRPFGRTVWLGMKAEMPNCLLLSLFRRLSSVSGSWAERMSVRWSLWCHCVLKSGTQWHRSPSLSPSRLSDRQAICKWPGTQTGLRLGVGLSGIPTDSKGWKRVSLCSLCPMMSARRLLHLSTVPWVNGAGSEWFLDHSRV